MKFTNNIHFYLLDFICFKNIWVHSWRETCKQECPQTFTSPVGPVDVCFLLARSHFWEFSMAQGQWFTVRVEPCASIQRQTRGLATYASSVSFGHPEHCFLTVWTPKSLGQDLVMMTILEDSAYSFTPTIHLQSSYWPKKAKSVDI